MCCPLIGDRERCCILPVVSKQGKETRLADAEQLLHFVACHVTVIVLLEQCPDLLCGESLMNLLHTNLLNVVRSSVS